MGSPSNAVVFYPLKKGKWWRYGSPIALIAAAGIAGACFVYMKAFDLGFSALNRWELLGLTLPIAVAYLAFIYLTPFFARKTGLELGAGGLRLLGYYGWGGGAIGPDEVRALDRVYLKLMPGVIWSENILRVRYGRRGRMRSALVHCYWYEGCHSDELEVAIKRIFSLSDDLNG